MKKILLILLAFFALSMNAQDKQLNVQDKQLVVNVYVDNTGSMFGYISHGNEFEWTISNMLTSINLSGLTDESNIHLSYINSEIFPYIGRVSSFIGGVTVHNAQTYKGDLGKTCMSNFFSRVLTRTGNDTISIIISDFIISPGKGGDAAAVLASEKNAIAGIVKAKIAEQPDLAMCMYRLESNFKGKFFDCLDNFREINEVRPYYMLVISNRANITEFRNKVPYQSLDNGHGVSAVTNSYTFFNAGNNTPKYMFIAPSKGSVIQGAKGVTGAKLGSDGKFKFTIAIDLSKYRLLGKYVMDPSSYILNNKQYKITKIQPVKGNGTTHRILIETEKSPTPGKVTLTLKNNSPQWVADYNVDANDCDKIFTDLNKTFGIKTIIDAIFSAYNYQKNDLFSVTVSINE